MSFIMPSVATDIALPWLITVLALTTLIIIIIMCICKKKKDSNSQTINERALPDIPLHDLDGIVVMDNGATVAMENNTLYSAPVSKSTKAKVHNPNKPHAPPPPIASVLSNTNKTTSPANSLPNSVDHVSNEYSSPNISHTYAEVQRQPKHPYEKLKGQSDSDHDTDEYDDSDKFRRNRRRWTNSQLDLYGPPPVPVKQNIYDEDVAESHLASLHEQVDSLTNDAVNSLLSTAGQAVAGNIPSAEIPYMTPPMVQPNVVLIRTTQETATIQEAPYTIISVREPLAKVRQQTKQKGRTQGVQTKHGNEGENYYSEVPEEEQMYAEISSSQELSSHLSDQRNLELPPAPPTVESLKSVAQAHSRQASIASTSSSGSGVPNVSTPAVPAPSLTDMNGLYSIVDKSNKQRKTIHLGEGASVLNFSETGHKIEDMYAKVRKKRVQSVRCPSEFGDITKFEGEIDDVFSPPTPLWIPHSPCGDNVSCQRSPVGSSYTPTVPSVRVLSSESAYKHEGWIEDMEPGYESVKNRLLAGTEPDYEKVRCDSDDPGYEKINRKSQDELDEPTYESVKHSTNRLINRVGQNLEDLHDDSDAFLKNSESTLDDSDPGYESVKKIERSDSDADPGYEAVKRQHEEEPDYESVTPKLSEKLNMTISLTKSYSSETSMIDFHSCDESEPGYESVRCTGVSLEEEDPNYEQVHQIVSDMDPDYEIVVQHNEEPDYERVKHRGSDSGDPNYERIDRVECDSIEPGYDTVKYISDDDNDSDHTGKIPVSHSRKMGHSAKQLNSTHIEVSIYSKYTRTPECSELSTSSSEVKVATNVNDQIEVVQNCASTVIETSETLLHETYTNSCKDTEENTSL